MNLCLIQQKKTDDFNKSSVFYHEADIESLFMAPLAGHRTLLIQVMTGDAEFMRLLFSPPRNLPLARVMALPALVFRQLLMLVVCKLDFLLSHFQVDDLGPLALFRSSKKQG